MSNLFVEISANRKRLSDDQARDDLSRGEINKSEILLNRRRAGRELIKEIALFLVEEEPGAIVDQLLDDPFSTNMIADPVLGTIHSTSDKLNNQLIVEAKPSCSRDKATYQRLLPKRAKEPLPHQSFCPNCSIEASESGWPALRRNALIREIDRALAGEEMIILANLASDSYPDSELDYQIEQIGLRNAEVVKGLLGQRDYDYYQQRFDKPPEQLVTDKDWQKMINSERRALSLAVDLS